jgi:hypothetical protein
MCRPCLYTAHVYRDDVTLNLGRYYIYDVQCSMVHILTMCVYGWDAALPLTLNSAVMPDPELP